MAFVAYEAEKQFNLWLDTMHRAVTMLSLRAMGAYLVVGHWLIQVLLWRPVSKFYADGLKILLLLKYVKDTYHVIIPTPNAKISKSITQDYGLHIVINTG